MVEYISNIQTIYRLFCDISLIFILSYYSFGDMNAGVFSYEVYNYYENEGGRF